MNDSTIQYKAGNAINSAIQKVIEDYYFNECSGDSTETYFKLKDTYLSTISLQDSSYSLFLVLLKNYSSGQLNSKVLFFNNQSKSFINDILDFNIHALYVDNDKLEPTELKQLFVKDLPEIESVDFNEDGINDFKFTRLYHNGTANAIETTILSVHENKIDTLFFGQKWVQ